MKLDVSLKLNLKTTEAKEKVEDAARLGLRDTIVVIHADAMEGSPNKTGHNMRSIASEVSGMGVVQKGPEAEIGERMVDDTKLEAAVYSTSGYGGYLETGTYKMPAKPYFRPALDTHKSELIPNIKQHMEQK
jgi:HK97 gp10 family phage protein